jgi:hypothetical protein
VYFCCRQAAPDIPCSASSSVSTVLCDVGWMQKHSWLPKADCATDCPYVIPSSPWQAAQLPHALWVRNFLPHKQCKQYQQTPHTHYSSS